MGEWMYRSTFFLTSALAGGEWSASRLGRFTPGERATGTNWIGGWVDSEPVWTTWRRENTLSYRDSNYNPSVVQRVASPYTDYAILASINGLQNFTKICKFVSINVCYWISLANSIQSTPKLYMKWNDMKSMGHMKAMSKHGVNAN
jgi:hypothetical protein